jgi:hypothetical protein
VAEFRELPEHELSGLDDDQLITYLQAARAAGRHEAMKPAVAVLVFGYHAILVNRARLKLPESDVEDVVSEAIASAIVSAFDGSSGGRVQELAAHHPVAPDRGLSRSAQPPPEDGAAARRGRGDLGPRAADGA